MENVAKWSSSREVLLRLYFVLDDRNTKDKPYTDYVAKNPKDWLLPLNLQYGTVHARGSNFNYEMVGSVSDIRIVNIQ